MKIHRTMLVGLVAGVAAFAVSSCAYDPYYSGGSYSSGGGYGDGYGYGGSSFSTSFFVSTGSPRWGYDPYAGAYYDYNRRCYYDPYLSGYYPVGYRPRYVYGSPHPHGWRQGRSSIAPPSSIRSYNLTNYQDRTSRYQGLGRDWSRDVRSAPPTSRGQSPVQGRDQRPGHSQGGIFGNGGSYTSSPDRGRGYGTSGSSGYNRGGLSSGSVFGGGNTSVAVPQPPVSRGVEGADPAGRQAFMNRMNESRQEDGGRGRGQSAPQFLPQSAPQAQPQPQPQPMPQAPQDDGRGRGGFQGGGGGANGGGGSGGRGVRGLGEG